jgi:hypothetical protein
LFRVEEARVELVRSHGHRGVVDGLVEAIILLIEPLEHVASEFLVTKRLTDGGQSVRHHLYLIK